MIIDIPVVYCKLDLHRKREIRFTNAGRFFTARHIRATPIPKQQYAAPILDTRKGGHYKQQVSQKRRCNDNRHDLPHGSQLWRIRQPQAYGGQQFPKGNADHAGERPAHCFRSQFSPGRQPGKTGVKTKEDGSATI